MAEHCFWPARKHGGEASTLRRKVGVTNGIDPAIQALQTPGFLPPFHRTLGVPKPVLKLPHRNHSMLPLRQRNQVSVRTAPLPT